MLSGEHRRWRAKSGRRAERRVEPVGLLRDSSVQFSTSFYGSGLFGDDCVRLTTENSRCDRNTNDDAETRLNDLCGRSREDRAQVGCG
jgi:hypothetical protein